MEEVSEYLSKRFSFPGHCDDPVRLLSPMAALHKGAGFVSSCGEKVKVWSRNEDGLGFHEKSVIEFTRNFVHSLCTISGDEEHPDGVLLLGSSEPSIQAYSASTGNLLYSLKDHSDIVCALAVGRYGTIVSGSLDKTAKVWLKQKCLMTLTGHEDAVLCILLIGGFVLTGSSDMSIRRWKAGMCDHTFTGHSGWVCDMCLLSESEFLSCSNERTIRHWSISGDSLREYKQHLDSVCCLAYLPGGKGFLSAGEDGKLCFWRDGILQQAVEHKTTLCCLCVLSTGDIICSGSGNVIHVYAVNSEVTMSENSEKLLEDSLEIIYNRSRAEDHLISDKKISGFHDPEVMTSAFEFFPRTSFITFANVNKRGIFRKLRAFNLEIAEENRLGRKDLELLERLVSGGNSLPPECFQVLWKVLRWPVAPKQLFPALDILRFSMLHKSVNEELCSSENGESLIDFVCLVLSSESNPVSNHVLVLRVLCNAFSRPSGQQLLVSNFDRITTAILRLPNEPESVQVTQAALFVNFVVAFQRSTSFGAGAVDCLRDVSKLAQSIFEPEACFLLLVAIGSAVHGEHLCREMASKLDFQNFLNMCCFSESEKVRKAAEMIANWVR